MGAGYFIRQICLVGEAVFRLVPLRDSERYRTRLLRKLDLPQSEEKSLIVGDYKAYLKAVIYARWLIGRSSCLIEALALQQMLRYRGIKFALVLGAKLDDMRNFHAHAWLEVNGEAVFGADPDMCFERFK